MLNVLDNLNQLEVYFKELMALSKSENIFQIVIDLEIMSISAKKESMSQRKYGTISDDISRSILKKYCEFQINYFCWEMLL